MGLGKIKNIALCVTIFSVLFGSCKNKSNQVIETDSFTLEISRSAESELASSSQTWHYTNERLCVLFGYGFNDSETVDNMLKPLAAKYGLDKDGGLILPLVFPTDFKHGGRTYVSELTSILNSDSVSFVGIVLLGAPENSHVSLARNQDNWNQAVPYPVISLFPQDDVLGLESTCDMVIDNGVSADLSAEPNEEESLQNVSNAPVILEMTVDYVLALGEPLPKDNTIYNYAQQMLKGTEVLHYIDPETGLQSINHFVIK